MIIQNNNAYSIGDVTESYEKLPVGTYRLRFNDFAKNFYLVKVEDFVLPTKLYGDFSICNRILNTFNNTEKNLGVLLNGERGSGKTITAKKVCIDSGKPIIVIDEYFNEIELITFLSESSLGSCVILIDEFEKIYSQNSDNTIILQLLDGASNSHHLFILTCNSTSNISNCLLNRPSRIYYRKEYDSVPEDVINEIVECELNNKKFTKEVLEVLDKFSTITYDILMSFIREINLYDQSPLECAKLMNFVPERVYIEVTQMFEDGTCVVATDDPYFDPNYSRIEVKDYTEAHRTGNITSYSYRYLNMKDITRINRETWEYKKDGLHYIIKKQTFKSLLF